MEIQRIKGLINAVDEHGEPTGDLRPVTIVHDPSGIRIVFGDWDHGYIEDPDVFIELVEDGTVSLHLHPDAGDPIAHVYMAGRSMRAITAAGDELCQLDDHGNPVARTVPPNPPPQVSSLLRNTT